MSKILLSGKELHCVISVYSVVLRETTLTISDWNDEPFSKKSGNIVRVVPLNTTEISDITQLKIRSSGWHTLSRLFDKICFMHSRVGYASLYITHYGNALNPLLLEQGSCPFLSDKQMNRERE